MRIVARSHAYPPGWNAGGEVTLHVFLRALVDRGHDVSVGLTWDRAHTPDPYELDGVRVVPQPAGGAHPRVLSGADVVITQDVAASTTATLAQHHRAPMVLLVNSYCGRIVRDMRLPTALRVFCSENLRANLGDPDGIVIPPPVNPEDYRTTPGDRVTLINLCTGKGADVFWALAQRMPDVEFLGVEGGYGRQIVRDYPNVEVADHTPDMRSVYNQTRVLLMPSVYETWGRVAVEAMCSGIPVIATDDDWSRESIGDAGMLLARDDLPAWEKTIRALAGPDVYGPAHTAARARADQLDERRHHDVARFVAAVEALAEGRCAA